MGTIELEKLRKLAQLVNVQLDDLERHKMRANSFHSETLLLEATREQANVERALQRVLVSMRQLSSLGAHYAATEETLSKFEALILPLQSRIAKVYEEELMPSSSGLSSHNPAEPASTTGENGSGEIGFYGPRQSQADANFLLKEKARAKLEEAETQKKLADDIVELQSVMEGLAQIVHEQHEAVDSIEAHVERANVELHGGQQNLKTAANRKSAQYPLAAGIIGAAVAAGPVGVVAGAGWALAAAVGGGLAGVFGGKLLKNSVAAEHA